MSVTAPDRAGWYPDPAGSGGRRWHDGIGWTAQVRHSRPSVPLGPGFARLGDWVTRFLQVDAACAVASAAYLMWAADVLARVMSVPGLLVPGATPVLPADLEAEAGRALLVGLMVLGSASLVGLVTGITWVVWQHRLAVSAPGELRRSPGMHVVSWLVPVVSYWWPLQNVNDLWRAYGVGREETPQEAAPLLVPLWWTSIVVQPLLAVLAYLMILKGGATPQTVLSQVLHVYAAQCGLLAVSAVLAARVVQRLSWRALVHYAEQQD